MDELSDMLTVVAGVFRPGTPTCTRPCLSQLGEEPAIDVSSDLGAGKYSPLTCDADEEAFALSAQSLRVGVFLRREKSFAPRSSSMARFSASLVECMAEDL
jgi:hypothetical protein